MRRFGVVLAMVATVALGLAGPAGAKPGYTASDAVKIDVMGEWAHPDDDVSIIGPCGVWHERYGIKCGIIQVTRGEGGGNAVGTELGPALGLRRENEDRVAHFRSGTVDLFFLDRVDFFYNTSAPLSQFFWGEDETLRRITRIIRMTQPEVYIGFTPSLAAGHGHHQQAGRYIWEGVKAAADPTMFPEQLRGKDALDTWQVKKVFSGGSVEPRPAQGTPFPSPHCTTGFVPAATNTSTVAGVWTGYDSPYDWPAGNVQGQPAGSPKSWAQVAAEGTAAYPTQSRVMFKGVQPPGCSRFGQSDAFVPFQPNVKADGTPNPLAGRDDAILFGATKRDPGGLPLGTLEYLTISEFFNVPGETFQATVHVKSGRGTLRRGTVELDAPAGWTVEPAKQKLGPISSRRESTVTFDVTPAAGAQVNTDARISALLRTGGKTGYTDTAVRVTSPVEGRFQRWGKWEEYDNWLTGTAPRALRVGRSAAAESMGIGEMKTIPVEVQNRSDRPQTGAVQLTLPAGFTADATSKSYGTLAPGARTTVEFSLTSTHTSVPLNPEPTGPATPSIAIPITTTYSAPAGSGSESLALTLVPTTTIPAANAAPELDGEEGAGEYGGPALDLGRVWEGAQCDPVGVDCGTTGTVGDPATSSFAKVTRHGDDLYFYVHVRDEFQSYAVTPAECVAHWLADSVEIMIDPRGTASQTNMDTASTFKLGVFPYTNDPSNSNGNGVNGPCWSRDADNHQGYSTGPLADTVADAPNAPGVQVASSATWVGSNETTTNHAYAGGGYAIEVKIPMAVLPAAVDPDRMAMNITPYDNDDNAAAGTTTLRHIDQGQSRLAWSAPGGVQANPWLWGHAEVAGYTPPADRPTTPAPPNVSNPNLNGVDSPQTIAQSARNGVPISGRAPAPEDDRIRSLRAKLEPDAVTFSVLASGPGRGRFFLWSGDKGHIPVWVTSCSPLADPPPGYGLTPCSVTDGTTPPWSPDMSGRVVGDRTVEISPGRQEVRIPIDAAAYARLKADGSAPVSFETPDDEVQALDVRLGGSRR
jgi:LmbE family N-acetylglucosaminyl deacetylase